MITISGEVGDLKTLTKLNIESNKLNTLPPEIENLDQLLVLKAKSNEITELPEEIGGLVSLQKFDFFSLISFFFFFLKSNLKNSFHRLDLSGNVLSRLPWSMGYMIQIEFLDVRDNNLIIPPRSACNMGTPAMLKWLRDNAKSVCVFLFFLSIVELYFTKSKINTKGERTKNYRLWN